MNGLIALPCALSFASPSLHRPFIIIICHRHRQSTARGIGCSSEPSILTAYWVGNSACDVSFSRFGPLCLPICMPKFPVPEIWTVRMRHRCRLDFLFTGGCGICRVLSAEACWLIFPFYALLSGLKIERRSRKPSVVLVGRLSCVKFMA